MATVLVVDDRAASREVARAALDLAGHEVIEAAEGQQALTLAHTVRPDVVLADVVMPGMDGYEFVNELHTAKDTAGIPVLLYTANYRPDEAEPLAAAYGVVKVVSKSAEPAELVAAVNEALGHAPLSPVAATTRHERLGEHLRTVNAKLLEKVLALDETQARFSALAELSPAGIAFGDADLRATYVNPRLSEISAMPATRLLNTGWLVCLPHQQTSSGTSQDHRSDHRADTTTYYGPVTLNDGRQRILHVLIRHLAGNDDEPSGFLAVINDVTQLIEAEQHRHELQRANEANERRRIGQRFESLARLSGAVAHDFNNLLGVILNFGEFVEDAVGETSGAELTAGRAEAILADLRQISQAGKRAAHLAHQLLTFGGREVVQPVVVNPNSIVDEVLGMLDGAVARQLTVATQLDPGVANTHADPNQLGQILLNLAINARDAMPHGGRLTFRTRNHTVAPNGPATTGLPPGDYVHIAVTDDGEGMPPEVVERAIEPFFTTKPKGHGTGLGLATAYGIVKQAGGNLLIDSAVGRGTTVHLYLPATDEQPRTAAAPLTAGRSAEQTVLLAEDEDGLRHAAARMLTQAGYRVLAAANGEEAIDLADRYPGPIHVVLTDVVMPRVNGPELAAALRHRRPTTPVLYMSGYAAPLMTEQGILEPGVTVLGKPFTRAELLAAIAAANTREPAATG